MIPIEGGSLLWAFANLGTHISAARMLVFLTVAEKGECPLKDLERELGLISASATRNVSCWTNDIQRETGLPGWGLIDRSEDPTDRQYKILTLTPKGQKFFEDLQASRDGSLKELGIGGVGDA